MSERRVGWCPGALRPMMGGDGLILRVKPRGGRLSRDQARGIADIAVRFGNGALDLTQRANLQIRGLAEPDLAKALSALDQLALLDPTPEAEAVRNVVSSPLAGVPGDLARRDIAEPHSVIPDQAQGAADPGSSPGLGSPDPGSPLRSVRDDRAKVVAFDISACVAALESRLAGTPALQALPAKFGFVVDDGGPLGLRDVPADIRFEAIQSDGGAAFAIRLGGATDEAAGFCPTDRIVDAAETLARIFIEAREHSPAMRRMSALVAHEGAANILRRAGLTLVEAPRPAAAGPRDAIGAFGGAFGVGAPFGRLQAGQLQMIAEAAASDLRLTPWRAILLPGVTDAVHLAKAGLIVDPGDPRLGVVACVGAPDCAHATTPVLAHAARLAAVIGARRAGVALHVSGCSKGCARGTRAPLTLVGHDGGYDLVLDGRADDLPTERKVDIEAALRRARHWAEADLVA